MKCSVIWINNCPVFHFKFNNQHELCYTFLRLQEFYESPVNKHRNGIFTVDEYIDWHIKRFGIFNYFDKWSGFNIPGDTVAKFFKLYQFQLSRREKIVLDTLKRYRSWPNLHNYKQDYCIIASCEYDKTTLEHELCHAAFYLDQDYEKEVRREINNNRPQRLINCLYSMGYGDNAIVDEINAYALTCWPEECKVTKQMVRLKRALKRIERKHGYNKKKYNSF